MNHTTSMRGFTLIEMVVYLTLYSMIMAGAVLAAYSLFESSERNQTKAMVQEEGSFLTGKVDWALTGAASAATSSDGLMLTVVKFNPSAGNPIVFTVSGGDMTLGRSGNPAPPVLNNDDVLLTCPPVGCFTRTDATGDGINPESIEAHFTLHATTSDGLPFSQNFSTVKFLRK